LSYHRTCESSPKSGSPTMTVCTNHVARGDLVENRLPFVVAETSGNVEVLVPEMVELEDQRVGLTAVDARPRAEELDEIGRPFDDDRAFTARRVRDVAPAVRGAVLLFVGGPAGATVVVPPATGPATPGEVRDWPEVFAASAGLVVVEWPSHEHMFP
jgi:hypothetical protein